MTLIQNQYYQATILLSGLKVAASNARVKEEFEKIGFKDVTVTGSARVREAKGCWIGQTQATEIPSPNGVKITDVKKFDTMRKEVLYGLRGGFGDAKSDITNYDLITVGGKQYSANQIVGKSLTAEGTVNGYLTTDFTKPFMTFKKGQIIGTVYSYINAGQATAQRAGSPLLMFFTDSSMTRAYYVKDDSAISQQALKDQGTLTVSDENKIVQDEQEKANDPIMYYLKKVGVPVLLIGGGIYLLAQLGKAYISKPKKEEKKLDGLNNDVVEFSKAQAIELVEQSGKESKVFFYNVFGWDTYFTLEPTSSTPTGKAKGFPSRVKIYRDGTIKAFHQKTKKAK